MNDVSQLSASANGLVPGNTKSDRCDPRTKLTRASVGKAARPSGKSVTLAARGSSTNSWLAYLKATEVSCLWNPVAPSRSIGE